jgi:dTDP-glucose 4,6-dehydratase
MRMLITGGCGFIGSNFIEQYIDNPDVECVVNIDCLTYAGKLENTNSFKNNKKYSCFNLNIRDDIGLTRLFNSCEYDTVVNFAAETHVDQSIIDPMKFIQTNINGTATLLEVCRKVWKNFDNKKFVHISTDEVFGALENSRGRFTLETPYNPSSPYSASKAASDHLCKSYYKTFGFPVVITNCCNNYGPRQYPEKLIPLTLDKLKLRKSIPVYGNGKQCREWIYVADHCSAIWKILNHKEVVGNQYLIGSGCEYNNLELIQCICDLWDEKVGYKDSRKLISFVKDRPGHDFRYALDSQKIRKTIGWTHDFCFYDGMEQYLKWYLSNS